MRIVEVLKNFERNDFKFEAGHGYVMAEDVENQLRTISGGSFGMSHPIEPSYNKYNGEDLSGKRFMCWRTGGIGDMFFLSPVLRYLKKKYPDCFIRVASGYKQPLENLPEIDELYSMPFDAKLLADVDYHLMFQGIIESSNEQSKVTHAVDMFFSYFNIDSINFPAEEKKPRLVFTKNEIDWVKNETEKLGITDSDFVIGIQVESSAPIRNFPNNKMKYIVDALAQENGVKIFLIGTAQQLNIVNYLKGEHSNVIPAINYNVRQSINLVTRYNLVIAPDSFIIQMAGALDKPLIGLYGPFPGIVRMKYFKNAITLEPKVVCSPCFKHDFRPCIKGFPSPCFSQVNPEDVLQAINFLRNKFYGGNFTFMNILLQEPNIASIEKYLLSADKGLCFFGTYFKHPNIIRVDSNKFCGADITDLSTDFEKNYPFVLFMNNFGMNNGTVYENSKSLVRPGGYFIILKRECKEEFFQELTRDMGKKFTLLHAQLDPADQQAIIVGRRSL